MMRMRLAIGLLVACGSPQPRITTNTSGTGSESEVLVFRYLETGLIMGRANLATYRLERTGERATITVTRQVAKTTMMTIERIEGWTAEGTTTYTGTARTAGDKLTLDLRAGTEAL